MARTPGLKDAQAGAMELVNPRGAGGAIAGVMGAPIARRTVKATVPGFSGPNAAAWSNGYLITQGIVGGMAAAGRLGRGGIPRAVGLGVAVEAGRTLLDQFMGA